MVSKKLEDMISKFPTREGIMTKVKVYSFFLQLAPKSEKIFMAYIKEVMGDGGRLQEHLDDGNLFYLDDFVSGYEVLVKGMGEELVEEGVVHYSGEFQEKVLIKAFLSGKRYKLDYKKPAYNSRTNHENKSGAYFVPVKTLELYLNTFYAPRRENEG